MIFINDKIYAKVWKVDKKEKYVDLQVTTSEKDRDGEYINSSWYPRLVGHAFNSLKDKIKEGDKLTINKAKLSMEKYTAKDGSTKSSLRFVVFEAEIGNATENETSTPASTAPAAQTNAVAANDNCPW